MTLPSIRDSASHTSVANETFRAVMPTDVQEGDLLVVRYAGDGNLATLQTQTGDFQGWNLYASQLVSGTLVAGELFKWADGTEGGDTLIAATSPSEKWCVSAVSIADAEQYVNGGGRIDFNTGSANPNQPSFSVSAAADHIVLNGLAGEGATATTGIPADYTGLLDLNNAAADGASLRLAYKAIAAGPTSEDPGAWTRASTAWAAIAALYRGANPTVPKHQQIAGRKTEVLSGGTKDYTVVIRAGHNRRFFCALHAASSTVTSAVLDPGGLARALTRVQTAAGAFAESAASGAARAVTWYEVWPVPPAGTYTLRVQTSVTTDCALLSLTMLGCEQRPRVHAVLNASGSGAAATGNLDIPGFGMVLSAGVQPLTAQPTNAFVWGSRLGMNQQSAWASPHYCTVFARRVNVASPLVMTLDAAGGVQAFSAFSVRWDGNYNAPWFAGQW